MFTIAPPFSPIQDLYAAKIYLRVNSIQKALKHRSIENAEDHTHQSHHNQGGSEKCQRKRVVTRKALKKEKGTILWSLDEKRQNEKLHKLYKTSLAHISIARILYIMMSIVMAYERL